MSVVVNPAGNATVTDVAQTGPSPRLVNVAVRFTVSPPVTVSVSAVSAMRGAGSTIVTGRESLSVNEPVPTSSAAVIIAPCGGSRSAVATTFKMNVLLVVTLSAAGVTVPKSNVNG